MAQEAGGQGQVEPELDLVRLEDIRRRVDLGFFTDHPLPRLKFRSLAGKLANTFNIIQVQRSWRRDEPNGFWQQVMGKDSLYGTVFRTFLDTGLTYDEQNSDKRETDRGEVVIPLIHFPLEKVAETQGNPVALQTVISRIIRRVGFLAPGEFLSTIHPRGSTQIHSGRTYLYIRHLTEPYLVGIHMKNIRRRAYATGFTIFYLPPNCPQFLTNS